MRHYQDGQEVASPKQALTERIQKTAAQGVSTLTDWERSFLSSLLDSVKKWGRLTAKQHEVYQRIEKKTDPSLIAGVVTRVGDQVFDGSLKNRLSGVKEALRSA